MTKPAEPIEIEGSFTKEDGAEYTGSLSFLPEVAIALAALGVVVDEMYKQPAQSPEPQPQVSPIPFAPPPAPNNQG